MAITVPYPVIDMKRTGVNIKRIRKERDISVLELQQFLGLASQQAIYQWQRGINLPTVDHLCALSCLFGVSMNEILVLKEPMRGDSLNTVPKVKMVPMMATQLSMMAA